jgi:hypothetical protein
MRELAVVVPEPVVEKVPHSAGEWRRRSEVFCEYPR